MKTVTVQEVTSQLPTLLTLVQRDPEVLITTDAGDSVTAKPFGPGPSEPPGPGTLGDWRDGNY